MAIQPKSVDFLRIDINAGQVRKSLSFCQSETTMRTVVFALTDSGKALDLTECLFAEILIAKADGYEADNSCVIDGDTIQYTFRSTDVSALGTNIGQILLTYSDGSTITTPTFEIVVYEKVLNPKVQKSMNEYTAITEQLALATNEAKNAKASADAAELAKEAAVEASALADQTVVIVEGFKDAAEEAESNAKISEENAASSAIAAAASQAAAKTSEDTVNSKIDTAIEYAERILSVEVSVEEDANRAETAADNAEAQVTLAAEEVTKAAAEVTKAAAKVTEASGFADTASSYANAAALSVEDADASADLALDYSITSKSYAMGNTGTREGEDTNNAKYFYEKSEEIYNKLGSALVPKGTITFEELPEFDDVEVGYMYNISNGFTTDGRFKDGSGKEYGDGNNVYFVSDEDGRYWDVLAGASVVRKASASQLGIVRPDNTTLTVDENGVLSGADQMEEIDYDYYLEHKTEIDASGKAFFVKGGSVVMKGVENITSAQYLANQDYYDNVPWFVNITDKDLTASDIPMENGDSVEDAISLVNDNLTELEGRIQNMSAIKSIQRGTSTSATVSFNAVDLSKASLNVIGYTNAGHTANGNGLAISSYTSTSLTVTSYDMSNLRFYWEVIEYN